MNKTTISVLLGILVLAMIVGVLAFWVGKSVNAPVDEPSNGNNNGGNVQVPQKASNDFIKVDSPLINQVIQSPLKVTGEARGNWFFEANLPMHLEDANGAVIARSHNQAIGEWMTENFVPFEGTITFVAPTTNSGFLVIQKDNPSGLPEHDAEIKVPIKFR